MQNDGKLELYLAHRPALIDYATPIVGDRMRAEDVVQEAYLRFSASDVVRVVERPVPYLYRIVRNLALDLLQRRTGESRYQQRPDPAYWMVPAEPRTPEEVLMHRQQVERVSDALSALDDEARIAVEMHRFGGYTLREIAERLEISVPTAHRLVRDALIRIAGQIEATDC
jgi:RNA polymerase sigma-70 factor (ECF subfamily)